MSCIHFWEKQEIVVNMRKSLIGKLAAAGIVAMSIGVPSMQSVQAAGTTSIASVLTSDGNKFDKNAKDFDIVTEAVLAILANNPDSAVKALTDGTIALTVFAPTDAAFRDLVKDLTGKVVQSEAKVFAAVANLGLPTVESVLLYHVIVGSTITSDQALAANGTNLKDSLGRPFLVNVRGKQITLKDANPTLKDPKVVAIDLNKGNMQIAHAIDRVLIPVRSL
jgi:uncharacterized surface protein with fasciclin (FAS1) repeats